MTTEHPITPPPELVQQLFGLPQMKAIAKAYQAGADQELEECIKWIQGQDWTWTSAQLRAARRPQPPSLKELLLQKLERIRDVADKYPDTQDAIDDLREDLEALPND